MRRIGRGVSKTMSSAKSSQQSKIRRSHDFSGTIRLSPSVQGVADRSRKSPTVSSWELVTSLLSAHPEYGAGRAKQVSQQPGPPKPAVRPVDDWLSAVRALLTDGVDELHGKLFIIGMARLDPALDQYLRGDGFLDTLIGEVSEPLDTLFAQTRSKGTGAALPDPTPLHLDNATVDDRLGRRAFAAALAARLGRIWSLYSRSGSRSSFALHIHGPWGSGKSSLLNLLRSELQPGDPKSNGNKRPNDTASQWIVVEFNAWQYQRLNPPWWALLDAIFRQACTQIARRYHRRRRALTVWLYGNLWRFMTTRRDVLAVGALLILAVGVIYGAWRIGLVPENLPVPSVLKNSHVVIDILAGIATVVSAMLLATRSLLSGSSRAAQAFMESTADPLDRVSRHFRSLLTAMAQPVVVFIDDLDRCQPAYVVTLLEGVQTLFSDPRVIYVVAADRRWLHTCFERVYEPFTGPVAEPGRALGSLFLEKVFELSVSVPRLSPDVQAAYWRSLIRGDLGQRDSSFEDLEGEAQRAFADAATEDEILSRLAEHKADPLRQQFRRQAAVERLANATVEESTSYFLEPFFRLLEPNARSMKRLLNAYAVHRDLAILGDIDVLPNISRRQQLVLWTIICLRWPILEEYFIELADGARTPPSAEIQRLLASEDVRQVLDGAGVDASLDLETIGLLANLRGSAAPAGSVA